ncbi:MAG: MBL fold metallo-hydrolase [Hyphomicrobiales bacterium]
MAVQFTILGCGSSMGVPRITGGWGVCDPAEPKNRRRRCAMLVKKIGAHGETVVLIDAGADMYHQLLEAKTSHLDAVLLTHEHADHTHGIDDIRAFAQESRTQMPVYMTTQTHDNVGVKFEYCFKQVEGSYYPAIMKYINIDYGTAFSVDGAGGVIEILPVRVHHGTIDCTAFLIEGVMYSADLNGIPQESLSAFEGVDIWVVDALRETSHGSHFGLCDAVSWIERMRPQRAILTNMSTEMDYAKITADTEKLSLNITLAYDGMQFSN